MTQSTALFATLFAVLLKFAAPALAQEPAPAPIPPPVTATADVILTTTLGDIRVVLETGRAPVTTANFLRYVDGKRFDGVTFYRAVRIGTEGKYGLVQGGLKGDRSRAFPPIAHEPPATTGLSHVNGAISMARGEPGTATADFFFVIGDLVSMDGSNQDPGYAAFGHVAEGMDIVRAILDLPRSDEAPSEDMKGQMLAEPVRILSMRRAPLTLAAPRTNTALQ